jgi:hypothetical protein
MSRERRENHAQRRRQRIFNTATKCSVWKKKTAKRKIRTGSSVEGARLDFLDPISCCEKEKVKN